ncbi:MAG: sugar transferase [Longimicrobiales bacterium]
MKRAIDVLAAVLGLLLLSPVLALTALLVRLGIGAPVLFRQTRPGLHGRPFTIIKFRTLRHITDEDGELLPDAQRMTRLGAWLRSSSVDELPELWNVLRGDMSLVGPRPLLMEYLARYSPEQARRHEMRPGITGLAQVNGRNGATWDDRLRMDVWYIDNQSLRLDARILLLTVRRVLARDGISQRGHATMEKFRGSTGGAAPSAREPVDQPQQG